MAMPSEQGHLAALLQELCPPAPDEGAAGSQEDTLSGEYANAAADIASKVTFVINSCRWHSSLHQHPPRPLGCCLLAVRHSSAADF
jgi:hypothetical protein